MDHGVLKEKVTDVESRGSKGEKLFVWFERRMWSGKEQMVAETLQDDTAAIVERRCLVFFKEPRDTNAIAKVVKRIPYLFPPLHTDSPPPLSPYPETNTAK